MRRVWGALLGLTSVFTCPCHFLVTIPWILAISEGTALGVMLAQHRFALIIGVALYFVFSLFGAYFLLARPHACGIGSRRG